MIEKNTIKSQDSLIDCNNGKRNSETLIQTISKLETTIEELERTKKQLKIAVEALKVYAETFIGNGTNSVILENGYVLEYNPEIAKKAFNDIEELEK